MEGRRHLGLVIAEIVEKRRRGRDISDDRVRNEMQPILVLLPAPCIGRVLGPHTQGDDPQAALDSGPVLPFPLGLQFHQADHALHRPARRHEIDKGNRARTRGDGLGAKTFGIEIVEQSRKSRLGDLIDRPGVAQGILDQVKTGHIVQAFEASGQVIIEAFRRPADEGEV